ncbi:MAG: leucine-rich repeat protein [Oscillospiraceae bacterium]|nr:leucine-rich repeat protein [Oscillospiraceae bacterium]
MKQISTKRILSLLLALALLLTLLPQAAPAACAEEPVYSGTCGDNLTWTFDPDTGTLTIEGSGAMRNYYFYSTPWWRIKESIISVSLPEGLTNIGTYAFSDCTGLTAVTIPEGVTAIGEHAFYNCTGLTEVAISDDVTVIGNYAFNKCTRLTEVTIPRSVTAIRDYAFSECSRLTEVTIPESVTVIGNAAFSGCYSLALLVNDSATCSIGGSNNTLGKAGSTLLMGYAGSTTEAYAQQYNYTFLPLGTSPLLGGTCGAEGDDLTWTLDTETKRLTISGSGAMADYNSSANMAPWYIYRSIMASIALPDGLSSIGSYAFYGCYGLSEVTIPEGVTSIGDTAFSGCTGLTEVTIPESVTSIGNYAFRGCTGLTEVTIPGSVNSIGNSAFSGCTGLTELTIPEGVTTIENATFSDCTGLTEVTIPESVTSIGISAFRRCTGLIEVTIPEGVTTIGDDAFCDCTGLMDVTIPASVTSIGTCAFSGCLGLTGFVVRNGNPRYSADADGVLFNVDGSTLICCPGGKSGTYQMPSSVTTISFKAFSDCIGLTAVTISESVISIDDGAFQNCTALTEIILPAGLQKLGSEEIGSGNVGAFQDCTGLTEVTIPAGVTTIGAYTFSGCTGLTAVTISEGVTSIGWDAFYGCIGLTAVTIPASVTTIGPDAFSGCIGLTTVTIPNSVTSIGHSAFSGCIGLTTVTIPNSVTFIDFYAFSGCTGLTEVTISEGVTSIGSNAFHRCTGLTEVTIPGSVNSIGYGAFEDCTGLTSVTIEEGVSEIDDSAFERCIGLTAITIPESVTTIGFRAFFGCSSLCKVAIYNADCSIASEIYTFNYTVGLNNRGGTVLLGYADSTTEAYARNYNYAFVPFGTFPQGECGAEGDNLTWILDIDTGSLSISGSAAMQDFDYYQAPWYPYRSLIASLCLPEQLSSLGKCAFYFCTELNEVTIPEGVTTIGNSTFSGCTGLTEVAIPGSVNSIGNSAFSGCTGLTELTIPEGVTTIENATFSDCTGLIEVTIPESVTSIGSYAFRGCTGLTEVTIPNSVTSIGEYAFYGCTGLVQATILNPSCELYSNSLPVSNDRFTIRGYRYSSAEVYARNNNVNFESIGDWDVNGQCGENAFWEYNISLQKLTITGNGAMNSAPWRTLGMPIVSVTMPEGLTSICNYAFSGYDITEISIPATIVSIGANAFSRCTLLTEVTIPESVTSIGNSAFFDCTGLTSITIPEGVTSIGRSAFSGCTGLSAVTIPAAVSKIGSFAFTGCVGLKKMLFQGNQAYIETAIWETEDTLEDLTWYESGRNMLGPHEQVEVYAPSTNCGGDFHGETTEDGELLFSEDMSPRYYAEKFGYTFYATDVFEDVKQGKYYTIPVAWAYGRGITSGKDDTHFAPNETCTRGQVVTFLWNAMGKPAPTITDCPFVDVKPGKYYYDAMLWALETGVTSGKDDTHFAPNETCTRGQVVTFIWNAMGKPEPTITDCPFVDVKPGKYYYNAMLWALENGVTSGTDATHFSPNQTCTRGQVVTFLYNALS